MQAVLQKQQPAAHAKVKLSMLSYLLPWSLRTSTRAQGLMVIVWDCAVVGCASILLQLVSRPAFSHPYNSFCGQMGLQGRLHRLVFRKIRKESGGKELPSHMSAMQLLSKTWTFLF
jgi:hypothetical protein